MTDTQKPRRGRKPALPVTGATVAPAPVPREPDRGRLQSALASGTAAPAPVTSLDFTATQPVDMTRYRGTEAAAATGASTYASDYGMNRNAQDALSFVSATGWPGFQTLAMLAQLPEYRSMHETLADESVRTWGDVVSTSKDEGADDKLEPLRAALERLGVRALVRQAVIHDQAYGGAHVLPRMLDKGSALPADVPLLLSPEFVARGSLEALVAVEPLWVSPADYNASNPLAADFYRPSAWMLLGNRVHASRLHTLISRPVSDMLKPAYSFRGVSITQLAMPYVDNFLRTRQSVSDTVKQFSITFLKADLAQMLQPGGAYSLMDRAQLFNLYRDNRNLGLIDKESEEFGQINTPLSGLDALQAQSQEQMAAVSHIPLVKLLGITPAGLNANSDGEIRVWYDQVAGYQETNLTPLMAWILKLVQLSEFGEVDESLRWEWNPLYELDDTELADVREKTARTDLLLMEAGVLSGEMIQKRMQQDPHSGYSGVLADIDPAEEAERLAAQVAAEAEAAEAAARGRSDAGAGA